MVLLHLPSVELGSTNDDFQPGGILSWYLGLWRGNRACQRGVETPNWAPDCEAFPFFHFHFHNNASPELIQILLQGDPHIKVCLPQLVGNQVSSHLCVENYVAVCSGDDGGGTWCCCCCFYCYYFLKTFPTVQRQPNLCRWDPEGGKQPRSRSGKNFQISFHHQWWFITQTKFVPTIVCSARSFFPPLLFSNNT